MPLSVAGGRDEHMRTVHRVCNPVITSQPVDPRSSLRVPPRALPAKFGSFPAGQNIHGKLECAENWSAYRCHIT